MRGRIYKEAVQNLVSYNKTNQALMYYKSYNWWLTAVLALTITNCNAKIEKKNPELVNEMVQVIHQYYPLKSGDVKQDYAATESYEDTAKYKSWRRITIKCLEMREKASILGDLLRQKFPARIFEYECPVPSYSYGYTIRRDKGRGINEELILCISMLTSKMFVYKTVTDISTPAGTYSEEFVHFTEEEKRVIDEMFKIAKVVFPEHTVLPGEVAAHPVTTAFTYNNRGWSSPVPLGIFLHTGL
jgi:hypothetical protein